MESGSASDGEYVKYMRDFPHDLVRVEAKTDDETPAREFLDRVYFGKFILAGVPEARIMESGVVETALGHAAYIHVRMTGNGSASRGTDAARVDAIRTVLAVNAGRTLVLVSRQRDEVGYDGSFGEKTLVPADQLSGLVDIAGTIQVRAKH